MISERIGVALLAAAAAGFAVHAVWERIGAVDALSGISTRTTRFRRAARELVDEGRIDELFGGRRLLLLSVLGGAVIGFSLLGFGGVALGMALAPIAVRKAIESRRRRYAGKIDVCAAELATALASSLSAGRSVRGSLLTVSVSTPEPLAGELERSVVDLTLGGSVADALASLRSRTHSSRIEALAGAIELHRGSGGDLVCLMRELADAFRERDRAARDALTASAQARFTALVVAAIPVVVALVLELALPGSVSGTFSLLPTALMMASATVLVVLGVLLCQRLAAAGR